MGLYSLAQASLAEALNERSLAEVRSWLEPLGLWASLAGLGRDKDRSLAEARSGAWQRRGAKLARSGLKPWGLSWCGQAARDRMSSCDGRRRQCRGKRQSRRRRRRRMKVALNTARHDWPHCCTFSISTSLYFHQQSLVLRSPSQPTALTHWQADPGWSIRSLSPALGVFSLTRYTIECQLWKLFDLIKIYWSKMSSIMIKWLYLIEPSLRQHRFY
jgi:hypothetical protein